MRCRSLACRWDCCLNSYFCFGLSYYDGAGPEMTKAEGALLIIVVFVAVMRWAFNKVRRERDEIARLR